MLIDAPQRTMVAELKLRLALKTNGLALFALPSRIQSRIPTLA